MKKLLRAKSLRIAFVCVAIGALTACVSNYDIQRIGDGRYRATAHAGNAYKAELRALNASYAYCGKREQAALFDDFNKDETTTLVGSAAIVSITFQCANMPNACAESEGEITFDC